MPSLQRQEDWLVVLGWMTTLIVPFLLLVFLQQSTLDWASINFMVIFSAALVMWAFRLVPEYAPAIFIILSTMLLGLAPQDIVLSGFGSDSFFLALSVFGIGAVLIKSKLFSRISLQILSRVAKNTFYVQMTLLFLGLFLTPVITAQSARVSMVAPLIEEVRKTAGLRPYSSMSNSLACVSFHGAILFSVIFLTGKSSNFVLYGMLSEQTQSQFGWAHWLQAASLPGLLLLLGFLLLLRWQYTEDEPFQIDKPALKKELLDMGSMSVHEWTALLSIITLMLGLIFSSLHQIPTQWVSFSIFFILLMSGLCDQDDFKNAINWPFLFYLGSIIGIMRCIESIGINDWVVQHFLWLVHIGQTHIILFIALIYALSWLGGLLFGTMASPAILFSIFLPIANSSGISGWMVAFVVLMATEAWILPYQSSYYLIFESWVKQNNAYRLNGLLAVNAYLSVVRLGAILLSIPFFRYLEII